MCLKLPVLNETTLQRDEQVMVFFLNLLRNGFPFVIPKNFLRNDFPIMFHYIINYSMPWPLPHHFSRGLY